jgi:hypothetical protein
MYTIFDECVTLISDAYWYEYMNVDVHILVHACTNAEFSIHFKLTLAVCISVLAFPF